MELPKPILVAAGGIAGATARWVALEATDGAAWALISINSLGAFILGLLAHGILRGDERWRALVGVGFCGALTTFSTFAVDIAADLDRGAEGSAAVLLVAGLVAGLAAGAAGMATRRSPR